MTTRNRNEDVNRCRERNPFFDNFGYVVGRHYCLVKKDSGLRTCRAKICEQ